jgi:hypothetical protein
MELPHWYSILIIKFNNENFKGLFRVLNDFWLNDKSLLLISIKGKTFQNHSNIEEIIQLDNTLSRGNVFFINCHKLEWVILQKFLKILNIQVFFYCEKLAKITLQNSIKDIDFDTFLKYGNLKEINISPLVNL